MASDPLVYCIETSVSKHSWFVLTNARPDFACIILGNREEVRSFC